MTTSEPVALWRGIDVSAVVLGNVTGLVVVLAAWAGAGHEVLTDRQIGWVDLGIAGLIIIAVANAGWLLAGRRACWRLRHSLLPAERGLPWPPPAALDAAAPSSSVVGPAGSASHAALASAAGSAASPSSFVASAAMTWFHSADCRMAAGKAVFPASEAEHRAAGRRPCAVCLPSPAAAEADQQ